MMLALPDELSAMLDIMQQDVGGMVLAGFLLGSRLAKESSDESKQSELLRAIASGEFTLQSPAAPLDVERIRTENQKIDRIIAYLICECISKGY
jgi:hypothetical protein